MNTNKPDTKALNCRCLQKKLPTSKPYPFPSTQNQYVKHKRASQAPDRVRTMPKLAKPAPKLAPFLKTQHPMRLDEQHLKKKPVKRRLDEDADGTIQMIRNMFGFVI